jgi:two-component system OmpR family response regulator
MLTAKDGEWDQAEALDAGADDYLTKPFSYVVLHAHLRALARRGTRSPDEETALRVGDLSLDYHNRRCARGEHELALSRREFDILGALLARRGEAISKEELMDRIWGPEFNGDPNIIEVYIGYLRKKIDLPFGRHSLETVRGFGYRLVDEHQG